MIKAHVAEIALTGLAAHLEQELAPLLLQAVEAGGDVLAAALQQTLSNAESRPGGPPAERTGELRQSMQRRPVRKTKSAVRTVVGVTHPNKSEERRIAKKAAALEFGGTDGEGRVHPAYPFRRITERRVRDQVEDTMFRVLERGR